MKKRAPKKERDRGLDVLLEFLSRYAIYQVPERQFQEWLASQYEPAARADLIN